MTLKERILALLAVETLDDDQLAARIGVVRQQVNQICRAMEYDGLLMRQRGPSGKIVNRLTEAGSQPRVPRSRSSAPSAAGTPISEDDVKAAVSHWLEAQGFEVAVAWGHDPGIDIEAQRGVERWVIEAKGTGGYDQMSRNYFFGVIGSLLQRMTDERAHYALAMPDVPPFINLVARFPELARRRTQLWFLLVRRDGDGFSVREVAPAR
jgi:hypothetical protein